MEEGDGFCTKMITVLVREFVSEERLGFEFDFFP
jgi:hypothetical protein